MLGERFDLLVDRIDESWNAHIADKAVDSGSNLGTIEPGSVVGISQVGEGYAGDTMAIRMKLEMFCDPERFGHKQVDDIVIEGAHRVHARLTPVAVSIQGAGIMIMNAVHDVIAAQPGLCNVVNFSMGGRRRGGFELVLDPSRGPLHDRTWLVPQFKQ